MRDLGGKKIGGKRGEGAQKSCLGCHGEILYRPFMTGKGKKEEN